MARTFTIFTNIVKIIVPIVHHAPTPHDKHRLKACQDAP